MTKLAYSRAGTEFVLEPQDADAAAEAIDLLAEAYGVKPASISYLLEYGWKQSLQDSAAQPAAEAKAEFDKLPADATDKQREAAQASINDAITGAMNKRADAIKAGTVAIRTGGERDPVATEARKLATAVIRKAAAAQGKKMPKGEDLKALVAKVAAQAAIQTQAKANVANVPDVEVTL